MATNVSPTGGSETVAAVPTEEIRFGVILNGGVSLAVWMGGAVLELDHLTKAEDHDSVYGRILRVAGCRARADVISGTSAGGINGAALALAQVNRLAPLASLRDIWVDQGQIEALLRRPFRGSPTSLLQGDEFFLPALNATMSRLAEPALTVPVANAPIDLSITTTVLRGNQTVTVDSMGQRLPQRVHAARFHWNREDAKGDPFGPGRLVDTARHLALAARCTASFPVAFEPVFVPVGRPGSPDSHVRGMTEEQRLRPDMDGLVEDWGDEHPARDRSRYAVDGGLLANTPTRAALEAVESMDPQGPVRRVMLMVYPHAGAPDADPPDEPDKPPTLTGTVAGLLGALTAQGGRTFVEEFDRHNRAAAGRRGTRQDILDSLVLEHRREKATRRDANPTVDVRLAELAGTMLPHYRRLRQWRAGRDLARRALDIASGDPESTALAGDWDFERVRAAAETAQRRWERRLRVDDDRNRPGVPYVPDDLASALGRGGGHDDESWGWGLDGALGVAEAAADLARRLVWVLAEGDDYAEVVAARREIAATMTDLKNDRHLTDDVWEATGSIARTLTPNEGYWRLRLAWYERQMLGVDRPGELERLIGEVAQYEGGRRQVQGLETSAAAGRHRVVHDELVGRMLHGPGVPEKGTAGRVVHARVMGVVRTFLPLLRILDRVVTHAPPGLKDSMHDLNAWRSLFSGAHGKMVSDEDTVLRRLLNLEVACSSLGDEVTTGATLPVEVIQLSAQTLNGFTSATQSADDKLGGMSVNRFGGFLKRSWRVNDWIWGRVDAATILCRTVLQPARLRRTAAMRGTATDVRGAKAAATAAVDELLGGTVVRDLLLTDPRAQAAYPRAVDEMAEVLDAETPDSNLPASMPNLAVLCAWVLHLEIVGEELPVLMEAIAADKVDGANARSNGETFAAQHGDLVRALTEKNPEQPIEWYELRMRALRAFDRAGVGRESLEGEAASDQMIRTATTAAAVATTVADSERSGFQLVKPVTRLLRGAMLLPFWVITGLSSRGVIARSLALLGLAVGAVLLALALFGVLPETLAGPGAALGAGALLVVFAYSALRTGTLLHGLVLLTPVAVLVAFAIDKALNPAVPVDGATQEVAAEEAAIQGGVTLLVVLALAIGLIVLGSLPASSRSVWGALDALAARSGLEVPRTPPPPAPLSGLNHRLRRALVRVRYGFLRARTRTFALLKALVGLAAPLLAAAVVVLVAVWAVFDPWPELLETLRDYQTAFAIGAVVVVAAAAIVAWFFGWRLQVLRRAGGLPDSDAGAWVYQALAHPAGAAIGWAVLYGVGYLLLAAFLVVDPYSWTGQVWGRALLLTSLVLGVVLVGVLPWWLPWRAIRSVESEARERLAAATASATAPSPPAASRHQLERRLVDDLVMRGLAYRWLVSPAADDDAERPRLRRRGKRLVRRVERQRERRRRRT